MNKLSLFLLLLLAFGCGNADSGTPVTSKAPSETEPERVQEKNGPKDIKAFFVMLPEEAGVPASDLEAFFSTLKQEENGNYTFNGETPEGDIASVWVHFYENPKDKTASMLGLEVSYGQSSTASVWRFSSNSTSLVNATEMLPEVTTEMFLAEGVANPDPEVKPQLSLQSGGDELSVWLDTWMNPEFEEIEPVYEVFLRWDGERFGLRKEAL